MRSNTALSPRFPNASAGSMTDSDAQADMLAILQNAHSEIETRFLDGGAVLVSTVEILNQLVSRLDSITGSMDHTTTQDMVQNLLQPVQVLSQLPARQDVRLQKFHELFSLSAITVDKISSMHLIIRYMQTFAVTAKITSASITDFATFVEEIRERVRSGAVEVGNLDKQVSTMRAQLQQALTFSTDIKVEYEQTIPDIVANLSAKSIKATAQHNNLMALANNVRTVVQSFQGKISQVLSGLQLGDITRQRIEHIRDMILAADVFLQQDSRFDEKQRVQIKGHIFKLAQAQLSDTTADFSNGCREILHTIGSFKKEAAKMMELRDQLLLSSKDGDENLLTTMQADIRSACDLVSRVQTKSAQANDIAASVTQSSRELVRGVGVIRGIQSDIHYMSLNTNLRSSKLGDSGKSVKVVSDELRKYSEELDVTAEGIVVEFEKLTSIADILGHDNDVDISNLEKPLHATLETLAQLDRDMNGNLDEFSVESLSAHGRIEQEVNKLDFGSNLGDRLKACLDVLDPMARSSTKLDNTLAEQIAALGQQIHSTYTMRQERELHQAMFPQTGLMPADGNKARSPAPAAVVSDEDLFEDALF